MLSVLLVLESITKVMKEFLHKNFVILNYLCLEVVCALLLSLLFMLARSIVKNVR